MARVAADATGKLAGLIDEAFGSYEKFAEQFKAAAVGRFGSGWGWLVVDNGALKIVSTPMPTIHDQTRSRC